VDPTISTEVVKMLLSETNVESKKQWEDPELISVQVEREYIGRYKVTKRELGLERADTLNQMKLAMWVRSMQSSDCIAFPCGSQTIFLNLQSWSWTQELKLLPILL
jgi:hypothetical protein